MVETRTLNQDEIEAMMARVNSVPMMHTLDLEILRLDHGECDAKVPRKIEWDGIYQTMHGGILATIADSVTCWAILTEIGKRESGNYRLQHQIPEAMFDGRVVSCACSKTW